MVPIDRRETPLPPGARALRAVSAGEAPPDPRRRLPDTRKSVTRKLTIRYSNSDGDDGAPVMDDLDIYVIVGLYPEGNPGEVFLKAGRMGSTVSGLLDALAISLSIGLQSGVPLHRYTSKLKSMRFEPSGTTGDPDMRRVASIVDAVSRWLDSRFNPQPEEAIDESK